MLTLQNTAGSEAASILKQSIFKEMQKNGQVPPGDNIREISNYEPGKTFITSLSPIQPEQIEHYLSFANHITQNISAILGTKEKSSAEYSQTHILHLGDIMLRTQNLAGRDSASKVKQMVFREMQKNDLVPKGENIRNMDEYLPGQTAIKSLLPLDNTQVSQYLNFANEVANKAISEKSTSKAR